MKFAKKLLFLTVTVVSIYGLLLAGCHTMQGVGQDIQCGGHAIAKAADTNKKTKIATKPCTKPCQ